LTRLSLLKKGIIRTSDKLNQGISAVKTINETVMEMYNNNTDAKYCNRIQSCLNTIVDVLEDVFQDMVLVDKLHEQIDELLKMSENKE
jgi:GTP1/Obg family GTP-binding protein